MTGLRHFQAGSCSSRVRQCACVGGDDRNGGGGGAQDTEVVFKVFVFFCGHLIAERTLKGRTTPLCAQRHGGTQLVAEEEGREKGEKEGRRKGGERERRGGGEGKGGWRGRVGKDGRWNEEEEEEGKREGGGGGGEDVKGTTILQEHTADFPHSHAHMHTCTHLN